MNTTPALILRPFLAGDQLSAQTLVLKGLEEHWGVLDPTLNPDLKDIWGAYADGAFLLGYWQGRLAGTGAFLPAGDGRVQIVRMSVLSELRRLGLGRAILRQLMAQARRQGVRQAILETTETWVDATSFYERCGFRTTHYADGDRYFELDLTQPAALDAALPFDCFVVRPGHEAEAPVIQQVERRAAALFKEMPDLREVMCGVTAEETLRTAAVEGRLWVAESEQNEVIGFALIEALDGTAHLAELAVLPEFGQRGLGKVLVETVCSWAVQQGYPAVTLTTQTDVPWNAPFYARLGFEGLPSEVLSAAARQVLAHEAQMGLPPERRVWMRRWLK